MSDATQSTPTSQDAAIHPAWCDVQHPATWPVHTAHFGDVSIDPIADHGFQVELSDYANGRPASVTLVEHIGLDEEAETIIRELTTDQARDLARCLAAAADVLDAARNAEVAR